MEKVSSQSGRTMILVLRPLACANRFPHVFPRAPSTLFEREAKEGLFGTWPPCRYLITLFEDGIPRQPSPHLHGCHCTHVLTVERHGVRIRAPCLPSIFLALGMQHHHTLAVPALNLTLAHRLSTNFEMFHQGTPLPPVRRDRSTAHTS